MNRTIAHSRPDIRLAVHHLSCRMQAPSIIDMQAAEKVLRYLHGTRDVGLEF